MNRTEPQPLTAAGLRAPRDPGPCVMVIFGATGDLTRRKLVPALYNLLIDGMLSRDFAVVGVGRRPIPHEEFLGSLRRGIEEYSRRPLDEDRWRQLSSAIRYVAAGSSTGDGFTALRDQLDELDRERNTGGNRLFYLAIPPSGFTSIVEQLAGAGLNRSPREDGWARIVLEKPIGRDLATARNLNEIVNGAFREKDVYRIDHYLGKETVQNLLVFRFANAIFEPLWNQKYVDHVQITVAESIGVEDRGAYFEEAGMTRDMVQNHMFQLLCLMAMEPPVTLAPDAIRDEKVKVLQALRPIAPGAVKDCTVRGQYAEGVIAGGSVPGYLQEPGVAPASRTETYVALRMHVDNWRWAGVPFYLRAGKRLHKRATEIALRFRDVPHRLFSNDPPEANTLVLRVQPDEGITISFDAKVPGTDPRILPVAMDFDYASFFEGDPPEAYERLVHDALLGDSTLFIRRDEVEASWSYVDRLEEAWALEDPGARLPEYTAGTWGPAEAHVMLAQDDRTWRRP